MDRKVGTLATKGELKTKEDKKAKLKAFDSSYFRSKSHFEDDGTQNVLYKYFKKIGNTDHNSSWKSKGLPVERINPPATCDNSLTSSLNYIWTKTRVEFYGSCLKQDKITFTHEKTVNFYIVYEINLWNRGYDDYLTLENSLFGAIKLVKNSDIDKYKYSGYGVRFDRCETFLVANGFGRNVMIFGVDMSSSLHLEKIYFGSWGRSYTRVKWYNINCRKNVFN